MNRTTNEDVLGLVYAVAPGLDYEVDEGTVTILKKQDHAIQRFFRRLRVRIPQYRKIELDRYASFVFLCIDGRTTVGEIGQLLDQKYGADAHPLYERLLLFLNYVNIDAKYIVKLNTV
jgi:hypothetical protein